MSKTNFFYKLFASLFIIVLSPISLIDALVSTINITFKELIMVWEGKTYSEVLVEMSKESASAVEKVQTLVEELHSEEEQGRKDAD